MRRRLGSFPYSFALGTFALGTAMLVGAPSVSAAPACAGATITTTSPSSTTPTTETIDRGGPPPDGAPEGTCWVEAQPYPFGAQGEAVSGRCPPTPANLPAFSCYLTASSLAFRAWNRGLAATIEQSKGPNGGNDPYGVWVYNGDHWYPSPGFPGGKECPGRTVLWAGKLDYWLVDPPGNRRWENLCRFDGEHNVWESLPVPTATLAPIAEGAPGEYKFGRITAGACFAWNDCWFFGTYGRVVHWDGHVLGDASPPRSESPLQGEYTAAVARQGQLGEPIGLAAAATAEGEKPVPLVHEGTAPPQLFGSSGGLFSPLTFAPPTISQPGDPYRTDLVAVDLSSSGQGWAAGNPAGVRLQEREERVPGEKTSPRASEGSLSPLVPVSASGASTSCAGPPPERFKYAPPTLPTAEVFLWSSIAAIPDGEAGGAGLAGGRWHPAKAGRSQRMVEESGEPAIARADCAGTTTVTRFVNSHEPSADQEGGVTAIAANAANDAWAATSKGPAEALMIVEEPPHVFRLTNGQPRGSAGGQRRRTDSGSPAGRRPHRS